MRIAKILMRKRIAMIRRQDVHRLMHECSAVHEINFLGSMVTMKHVSADLELRNLQKVL